MWGRGIRGDDTGGCGRQTTEVGVPCYGFYIEVPDGALPPDVTAHVAVKVILAGQFELPENSQLISSIYWVSSSEVFLKPGSGSQHSTLCSYHE